MFSEVCQKGRILQYTMEIFYFMCWCEEFKNDMYHNITILVIFQWKVECLIFKVHVIYI